jgi:two-component system, sensor histidine kinase and response regulator
MTDTSEKRIQDRITNLCENTDFIATLFESVVGYAIIAADFDGNILAYNEGARQLYGHDPEEVVGKQTIDIFFAEDFINAGYFQQAIDVLLETGRFSYQGDKIRKNGARFPAQVLLTLTKDKTDKVVGFVEIVEDLTERLRAEEEVRNHRDHLAKVNEELCVEIAERKRTQDELQQAKRAAEAANQAKSEFLANMSHEIRTPMNGIIGMTDLALNTELTVEQREFLDMVKLSAEALLALLNDILDFSKIEAGKLELDPHPFELRDHLDDTMHTLGLRAYGKGLELACHVLADVPDALVGDANRLRQIIINLVGNAIKFTEHGEVVVHVSTEDRTDHDATIHFAVSDTGIGIPPEKQRQLFQPFAQADTSTTRKYGGTGLGLAISRQLTAIMGGRIWLDSVSGQGSTFHFTARFGVQTDVKPKLPLEWFDIKDLPVLIVDDNSTNRRILFELLNQWGMKPSVVETAEAALVEMHHAVENGHPYPIVLVDFMMPQMDGFGLAEEVHKDPSLAASSLMMLSSAVHSEYRARSRELGFAAYLNKPIKQSELLDTIMRNLRGSAAERQKAVSSVAQMRSSRALRILLAEDSIVNQKLAVRLLEKWGHKITVASTGRQALDTLDRQNFDLVLMDVQMPEMDGCEAATAIRYRERTTGGHVPIIAMTAHAMKGDRELCLKAGMDSYVSKPIRPQELFDAIEGECAATSAADALAVDAPLVDEGMANWATALERIGGDASALREVVELFAVESVDLLSELRDALAQVDPVRVRRVAHTLRSTAGLFEATPVIAAASTLETMGQTKDLTGAESVSTKLAREVERLCTTLKALAAEEAPANEA